MHCYLCVFEMKVDGFAWPTFAGEQVDQFQCLPNMYRCPGTFLCINFTSLCDGHWDCPADGADEGGHCCKSVGRKGGEREKERNTLDGCLIVCALVFVFQCLFAQR